MAGRKRESELGDFFRGAVASRRDLIFQFPALLRGEAGVHVGIDHAAGNGIDLDVARSQLFCQRACEGVDAALAGGIGDFAGGTDNALDR